MARFEKGRSGNPAGRPPAPKGKPLSAILADEDARAILQTVIQAAKGGDLTACRMLLDRVFPPLKAIDQPVQLDLPPNAAEAATGVLDAVGAGIVTPDQGARLMAMVADQVRILELTELEQRIALLEAQARAEAPHQSA